MAPDDMAMRLKEIQDKVSESLQYSIDSLVTLREEERERLEIRTRREGVQKELNEVIVASEKAEAEYRRSRQVLLDASRSGNESREKEAYERAMNLMKIRGAFEEREKHLAAQRDDLDREERRIERLIARSEEMGNRFRVVLNLLNFSIEDEGSGTLSPEQKEFSAGLLLAERESISLSRELHDGPIQKFSAAGLMIDLAGEFLSRGDFGKAKEELARTRSHIGDALEEFRSFLFQLNPTGLKEGFDVALSRLVAQTSSLSGADVRYAVEGQSDLISLPMRTTVFKIIQQAVVNAVKNGKARRIRVLVSIGREMLRVKIVDDGLGFDVEKVRSEAEEKGAWGLVNMEDRAAMIGGEFSVLSEPGKGATVSLAVPLPVKR
ncbi:MAG TPA: histidine kinase [Aminivibrio sp.]|nr:histidine kinase [Aminivibrio sp.]